MINMGWFGVPYFEKRLWLTHALGITCCFSWTTWGPLMGRYGLWPTGNPLLEPQVTCWSSLGTGKPSIDACWYFGSPAHAINRKKTMIEECRETKQHLQKDWQQSWSLLGGISCPFLLSHYHQRFGVGSAWRLEGMQSSKPRKIQLPAIGAVSPWTTADDWIPVDEISPPASRYKQIVS